MMDLTDTQTTKQIGVRVPNAMHAQLEALAQAERRSIGFIVRDCIAEVLERRRAEADKPGRIRHA
jgi:predicted transcriptional regulator